MKAIPYFFTILFLIGFNYVHAQVSSDMQVMHMIKDFYTAYSSLDFRAADKSKLYSLIDKYLTPEEAKKVKKGYKDGHDIMTTDSGINKKSLESMVIGTISDEKSLNIQTGKYVIIKGVKDAYEVSYIVNPVTPKLNETITETGPIIDILVKNITVFLKFHT